ncbi:MAG: hypothetical protein JJ975_08540 [Bacteroidia bacterium]|nr:hypothetical protein [Bacteroidia bacterium]
MKDRATSYFGVKQGYFWSRDEEDYELVLIIPGGPTIAYDRFFLNILKQCNVNGIPPFGAGLMMWVATSENGQAAIKRIGDITAYDFTPDVHGFLSMLAGLPNHYHEGERRVHVVRGLFEASRKRHGVKDGFKIIRLYEEGGLRVESDGHNSPADLTEMREDFECIRRLSRRFPSEKSLMDYLTKLPYVPDDFVLELPTSNPTGEAYIELLIGSAKTFYVAALVNRIWAVVNIPKPSSQPSKQPMGGYADVTNKGSFDKLLTSEFAYDDLRLMSRLANNEALYLRKETPPQENEEERLFLIDVSIRNWGIPKTIGYALALANATNPKHKSGTKLWAIGSDYTEFDVESMDGLVDAIAHVDAVLHAGAGLKKAMESEEVKRASEVILVSCKEAEHHTDWNQAIQSCSSKINAIIQTSVDGEITVKAVNKGRQKITQQLKLPLNQLWEKKVVEPPRRVENDTMPLLFKPNEALKLCAVRDNYQYYLSREGTLFRSFTPQYRLGAGRQAEFSDVYGLERIATGLPKKQRYLTVGSNVSEDLIVLLFTRENREIRLIDIQTKAVIRSKFNRWDKDISRTFRFEGNNFYYDGVDKHWEIGLDGKITEVKGERPKATNEADLNLGRYISGSVLKKIKSIHIDAESRLCLNNHPLVLYDSSMRITEALSKDSLIVAEYRGDYRYEFHDGSAVLFNADGMITLISAMSDLPEIYIPSVLNHDLGVATQTRFAGDRYFHIAPKVRISIEGLDNNDNWELDYRLRRIYNITGELNKDEFKKLNESSQLPLMSLWDAEKLIKEFEKTNFRISYDTITAGLPEQTQIPPADFHREYIAKFIDHIVNYAS